MGSTHDFSSAAAPRPFDSVIASIAEYASNADWKPSDEAVETARYALLDSLGCGLLALEYPACTKLLGQPEKFDTLECALAGPRNWAS